MFKGIWSCREKYAISFHDNVADSESILQSEALSLLFNLNFKKIFREKFVDILLQMRK